MFAGVVCEGSAFAPSVIFISCSSSVVLVNRQTILSAMNILPKKSWHVRTRANIDKVRRDEKEAAVRENDRLERIAIAEREARTAFLRQQTTSSGPQSSSTSTTHQASDRFSIFDGVDHGKGDIRRNKEREKEEKERTEEWEQKVGILTYLHKKETETSDRLWYLQPHDQRMGCRDERKEERQRDRVAAEDPLVTMRKYADQIRDRSSKHKSKKKAVRHKDEVTEVSDEGSERQRMREQRLRREEKERRRSSHLLAATSTPRSVAGVDDERYLRFNSQFNPQLARH